MLHSPGVTSLQAGVLPGARVCPDLVLRYETSILLVLLVCSMLMINHIYIFYVFCLVDCRQNQSESDSALETFRKAELELKDCCTDYEHCASSIAVPSIFLQILCSLRRSLYATTLYLTWCKRCWFLNFCRTMTLISSIHSFHFFLNISKDCSMQLLLFSDALLCPVIVEKNGILPFMWCV